MKRIRKCRSSSQKEVERRNIKIESEKISGRKTKGKVREKALTKRVGFQKLSGIYDAGLTWERIPSGTGITLVYNPKVKYTFPKGPEHNVYRSFK